jgi:hypothetical protein
MATDPAFGTQVWPLLLKLPIVGWVLRILRWAWRGANWPVRAIRGHFRLHRELLQFREQQQASQLGGIAGQFIVALTGNQANQGLHGTKQLEELRGLEGDRPLIRRIENEIGGYRSVEHLQEALPTFPRRTQSFGVYVYQRDLRSPAPLGTLEPTFRVHLFAPFSTIEVYLQESDGDYVWFEGRHLLPVGEADREEKRASDFHQSAAMERMRTPRGSRPYPIPIDEIRELATEWFACIREADERLREYRRGHDV